MNPLGLVPGRLIIAETPDGEFAGMAQLEPLPAPGAAEFRSLIVAPKFRYGLVYRSLAAVGTAVRMQHSITDAFRNTSIVRGDCTAAFVGILLIGFG